LLGAFRDLEHQLALTEALARVTPVLTSPAGDPLAWIADALATQVLIAGRGPTSRDVHVL
jgi:hypothetical protein